MISCEFFFWNKTLRRAILQLATFSYKLSQQRDEAFFIHF